ncbi:MAG: restriction endonuclease subunit S [Paludibacteraceae bacterium]|nr:restriction endonuclease subunit S [Paludibacteraceae bacterium]
MATENKKYIPALRFPEFQNDGEWAFAHIGDLIKTISPPQKLPTSEYKLKGRFPIIDQSIKYVAGYSDEQTAVVHYNESNCIVFGDHTCTLKLIDFPFIQGADGIKIFSSRHKCLLNEYLYQYILANPVLSKAYKRHFSDLKEKKLLYPTNIHEQRKIADCFLALDKYIDATKRKLELLKEHKNGLMQKLFPTKGKTTPELRFPEFQNNGEWQTMSLGEITSVVNRRNKSNRSLPIYSINNADGFVPQSQQFAGMDSEARGYDISAYKIIGKHTFAYNPARINVGSIGYSGELKDILISSLYVCFKTMDNVDDDFLMCFFNSYIFNQAVESNVEGGIRSYLFYENFSRINIAIPSLYEQKRIASCITSIEDMIKKTNKQIILFETHKKGLLQQLFPMIK